MKPITSFNLAMSMVEKAMNVTICPIVARFRACSQMPSRKIASKVRVAAARAATTATAHQERTGSCADSTASRSRPRARGLAFDPGEALDHRDIAEHVGGALCQIRVVALDVVLQDVRPTHDEGDEHPENSDKQNQ